MVGVLPAVHDLRPNTSLFTISPGRFFAVNEIKGLFAYIVATYDIKFEEGKSVPHGYCVSGGRAPAAANVMFRVRQK
jgi:hypothetical protein